MAGYGLTAGLIALNLVLAITLFLTTDIRSQTSDKTYDSINPFEVHKANPIDLTNASAVFNTVQSALKEKDSNVQPNGVSFIPAYVPPNTRFYHATAEREIPGLFEWIAMDYEFSYLFSGTGRRKYGGHIHSMDEAQAWSGRAQAVFQAKGPEELGQEGPEVEGLGPRPEVPGSDGPGGGPAPLMVPGSNRQSFLYTFRTTKPLTKLILLDGASAAKSSPKMDQQMILSRQANTSAPVHERVSSDKICKWGKPFGLEGIIRLEVGFEIIICDFYNGLELIGNVTVNNPYTLLNMSPEVGEAEKGEFLDDITSFQGYEWIKAGSISDTGEDRILMDFSGMVTPLNKTYIDPNPFRRNISYILDELKEDIISDLEGYMKTGTNPFEKTNWQTVTESIVFKFSPILSMLNGTMNHWTQDLGTGASLDENKGLRTKKAGDEIMQTLFSFIRRHFDETIDNWDTKKQTAFNSTILDYVYHTYPLQGTDYLIYSSLFKVQYEITQLVFDFYEFARGLVSNTTNTNTDSKALELQHRLITLLETLNWSDFYQCSRKCNYDEICYAPTWGPSPMTWGPEGPGGFFVDNGDYYSIDKELQCIGYKDVIDYRKKYSR